MSSFPAGIETSSGRKIRVFLVLFPPFSQSYFTVTITIFYSFWSSSGWIGFLHAFLFWDRETESSLQLPKSQCPVLGISWTQQYLAGTCLGQSTRLQDQRNMERETENQREDAAKPEVPLLTSTKAEVPLLTSLPFCWLAYAWMMHHQYTSLRDIKITFLAKRDTHLARCSMKSPASQ